MTTNPYRVLGTEPVILRGRQKLLEQLTRQLVKPTPDHVQVVGPKLIGKTVFLKHVVDRFQSEGKSYDTAIYWDLGHQTPSSDNQFLCRFAEELKSALMPVTPEVANEIEPGSEDLWDILPEVLEFLEDEGQRLLAVLDGFDRVLGMTSITRNLWDYLRSLAEKKSLSLVTGSRRPLREICKTEASQTSDFWNIFNPTPLKVSIFEESDWPELLSPFQDLLISFDSSGQKELINWSGGVPILAAAICSGIWSQVESGATVSKQQVDATANQVLDRYRTILDELWDDCSVEVQSDLIDLAKQDLPLSQIPPDRCKILEERGYGSSSGSKLRASCRFIQEYAAQQGSQVNDLRRLFGNIQSYKKNVRSLLELRLAQIQNADPELQRRIRRAIEDLHPEPKDAIIWFRQIADRVLELIWNAEVPDRQIPPEWIEQWEQDNEWKQDQSRLPGSRGIQCEILRVMTNTRKGNTNICARFVSKSTAILVSHIQTVGDFGQHTEGQEVSLEVAVAFCLSAIELCDRLAHELPCQ
ncbi:MAG: hypothetical protein AB4352_13060 [Hormoscilla sp.]